MALPLRPHCVKVYQPTELINPQNNVAQIVEWQELCVSIKCQVEPITADVLATTYGLVGVEQQKVRCNLRDAETFAFGARVYWQERIYRVISLPERHTGTALSHAVIRIQREMPLENQGDV
jgi:Phage head-tail joining protein